jgi:hypothetical protein
MDASRKANRADNEVTLQHKSQQDARLTEELHEEKLTELLAYISELGQTSAGATELERRVKLFGQCQRIEGESSGQFYGRLRVWMDKILPQSKSPLHPPRQNDNQF